MSNFLNLAYNQWSRKANIDIDHNSAFNIFMDKLREKSAFSFVRFGDGELGILKDGLSWDGKVPQNYTKEAKKDLESLISLNVKSHQDDLPNKVYIGAQFGDQWIKQRALGETAQKLKKEIINVFPASIFSWATVTDKICSFFEELNEHESPIILVGPKMLRKQTVLKNVTFVETPKVRCWESDEDINNRLRSKIKKLKSPIIIYCCSITAKRLILKNYLDYGDKIYQIDFGANLNPYSEDYCRLWLYNVCLHHFSETNPDKLPEIKKRRDQFLKKEQNRKKRLREQNKKKKDQ